MENDTCKQMADRTAVKKNLTIPAEVEKKLVINHKIVLCGWQGG